MSAGGEKGSQKKSAVPTEEGSDDDWDTKGKKKKGARRKGGGKGKAATASGPAGKGGKTKNRSLTQSSLIWFLQKQIR